MKADNVIKPMLAGEADLTKLKYPLYASPKLDGVRALVHQGVLRSRSWKEFPNNHVQTRFSNSIYDGLDGELIFGDPRAKDVYRVTNSSLQRESGKPDVKFYLFDLINDERPYESRREELWFRDKLPNVVFLESIPINNETELLDYEATKLDEGYEGLILRSVYGTYKHGRATTKGGELLKLKRFKDSEAEVLDYFEEMHNANASKKNAFGRTERSSHKANLVGKARLGGFIVRDIHTGVEFSIGSGFTEEDRILFWQHREELKGRILKYKYFPIGVKDKPRHPVFLGWRHKWDL